MAKAVPGHGRRHANIEMAGPGDRESDVLVEEDRVSESVTQATAPYRLAALQAMFLIGLPRADRVQRNRD